MKDKKGQAALEFLMTYGWAILVVLVVIGALAYFGILNPSILLPEKCTLQMGVNCKDFRIDAQTGNITLNLENGMGKDIVLYHVNITGSVIPNGCYAGVSNNSKFFTKFTGDVGCDSSGCNGCGALVTNPVYYGCNSGYPQFAQKYNNNIGARVPQGQGITISAKCNTAPLSWTGKAKSNIIIQWYYADSSVQYLHTMEGELLAKVEGQ